MKRTDTIFSCLLFLFVCLGFGSWAQSDSVYLHNGKALAGTIVKANESMIIFREKNDPTEHTYGKYAVKKYVLKTGAVHKMSAKVLVASKDDWDNVVLLDNADEVAGLNKVDEIRGRWAMMAIMMYTTSGPDNMSIKHLKKDAAKMGCAFVLITAGKGRPVRPGNDDGDVPPAPPAPPMANKAIGYTY